MAGCRISQPRRFVVFPASITSGINLVLRAVCAALLLFVVFADAMSVNGEETAASSAKNAAGEKAPVFEQQIAPILKAYCWKCHGGEARKGGLDLRTFPLALHGGTKGPALVRGNAGESLLVRRIEANEMPPKGELRPTSAHLEALRRWIEAGAPANYQGGALTEAESPPLTDADRKSWAYRTPVRPEVPQVRGREQVRTPADAFLLQKLEAKQLSFSEPAERGVLIRRAFLDVVGLPPSTDEVDAFLADDAPDAWERLVERLLSSPHFGERWGRHWLDACGYVDSLGMDNDATITEPHEGIWKYRDYVVGAFNADKPYDRFLLEQIAGDELVDWRNAADYTPEMQELLVATGFLRQAADVSYAPELNTFDIRSQVVFDTVQIFSSNLLGLTVHCAQCHTHKFDPISQADYYRMVGLFAPSYDVQNWTHSKERLLPDVPPARKKEIDAHNTGVDKQIAECKGRIDLLRKGAEPTAIEAKVVALPEAERAAVRAALAVPANQRSVEQQTLASKIAQPPLKPEELDAALEPNAKKERDELGKQIAALEGTKKSHGTIQALWDVGPAPPNYLLRRGDYKTPGAVVEPGVIAVLDNPRQPFRLPETRSENGSSGYRTALAKWLTRQDHPLTARVFVNRIWQHYFGTGIVATPDNFGVMGTPPTHPELLDWLAVEFMQSGWNIKHIHRLILNSSAYRQASTRAVPEQNLERVGASNAAEVDPGNEMLWKMPLRRLESEIVRDAILATSGELLPTLGGSPVPIKPNADSSVEIDSSKLASPRDAGRRSLYVFARRNYQLTELNVFDQPLVAANCTRRTSSAVVSQSLALMNGKFLMEQAERFAQRLQRLAGDDAARQIELAFRLALSRRPSEEEVRLSRDLLARQAVRHRDAGMKREGEAATAALTNFCQMLLNTNEFLYVE